MLALSKKRGNRKNAFLLIMPPEKADPQKDPPHVAVQFFGVPPLRALPIHTHGLFSLFRPMSKKISREISAE